MYFREVIDKVIKQGHLKFIDKGKEMMINKNPFLIGSNYVQLINEFNIKVNVVCYYEYDDPLDAPFFLKLIHQMEKIMLNSSKVFKWKVGY